MMLLQVFSKNLLKSFLYKVNVVGKTTLVKKIVAWTRSRDLLCLGCAFTALAAKNYEDFTTAHDLFRFPAVDEEDREPNEPIHCKLNREKNYLM